MHSSSSGTKARNSWRVDVATELSRLPSSTHATNCLYFLIRASHLAATDLPLQHCQQASAVLSMAVQPARARAHGRRMPKYCQRRRACVRARMRASDSPRLQGSVTKASVSTVPNLAATDLTEQVSASVTLSMLQPRSPACPPSIRGPRRVRRKGTGHLRLQAHRAPSTVVHADVFSVSHVRRIDTVPAG